MSFPESHHHHHHHPDSTQIVSTSVDADPSLLRLLWARCFLLPSHPASLSRRLCVRECCKYHARGNFSRSQHNQDVCFLLHLRTFQCSSNSTNRRLPCKTAYRELNGKSQMFCGRNGDFVEEPFLAKRSRFRFLSCSLYMILAALLYQGASQVFDKMLCRA